MQFRQFIMYKFLKKVSENLQVIALRSFSAHKMPTRKDKPLNHKQTVVREEVVTQEVKRWSTQSEVTLLEALSDVDWNMFQSSSNDVIEFTEVVASFIATVAENVVPSVRVKFFTTQKPWVDRSIRAALNAFALQCTTWDSSVGGYKATSYRLRKDMKDAELHCRWSRSSSNMTPCGRVCGL